MRGRGRIARLLVRRRRRDAKIVRRIGGKARYPLRAGGRKRDGRRVRKVRVRSVFDDVRGRVLNRSDRDLNRRFRYAHNGKFRLGKRVLILKGAKIDLGRNNARVPGQVGGRSAETGRRRVRRLALIESLRNARNCIIAVRRVFEERKRRIVDQVARARGPRGKRRKNVVRVNRRARLLVHVRAVVLRDNRIIRVESRIVEDVDARAVNRGPARYGAVRKFCICIFKINIAAVIRAVVAGYRAVR